MIKISNLIKVYNKGQQNEIRAIDGVGMTFPEKGLVCFLGPSGCGKTTLLNVIGGLDKADEGTITINNQVIDKYNANLCDDIRNKYIGYIFQNYILFPDMTVYDNLALVLKMYSLTKEEIDYRIDYALKAVHMEKYERRLSKNLSGGQMQRVAIARALVKSPEIIIADEPTGNLDGRNTTQIMNIIKKLSKECLVILVTHERKLAKFYGDLIIEIVDGKVVNKEENKSATTYEYQDDQNIYLGEFDQKETNSGIVNYNLYSNEEVPNLDLKVIYKNDTFYIVARNEEVRIRYVGSEDEINVVDSKKPKVDIESIDDFDYFLPKINDTKSEEVIKFKDTFKTAWRHIRKLKKKQAFFMIIFIVTAIFIVSAFTNIAKIVGIEESEYLCGNKNTISIVSEDLSYETINHINEDVEGTIIPFATYTRMNRLYFDMFNQSKYYNSQVYIDKAHTLYPVSIISDEDLTHGKMPTPKTNEVVIDALLLDYLLENTLLPSMGAYRYEQIIGTTLSDDIASYTIVGISQTNSSAIYLNDDILLLKYANNWNVPGYIEVPTVSPNIYYIMLDYLSGITSYKDLSGKIHNISELTLEEDEILIDSSLNLKEVSLLLGSGTKYKVAGTFVNDTDEDFNVITQLNGLKKISHDAMITSGILSFNANNTKEALKYLDNLGLKNADIYLNSARDLKEYRLANFGDSILFIFFAIISLILSLVFMFLTMRSSLISRIYEVGVYRALGIKKREISKIFIAEIAIITLISSFVGYLIASVFIWEINSLFNMTVVRYPWYVAISALVFIVAFNFIVGMIPVRLLLRKTPTEILTKYDI